MADVLAVVEPYWYQDTWVFDDASRGLEREPLQGRIEGDLADLLDLVGAKGTGLPQMVDRLVKDIPDARKGFTLLISPQPFTGYQAELTRATEDFGGWTFITKNYPAEVWLPPTLLGYFDTVPESLYIKAESMRARYELIKESLALKDSIGKLEQMAGKLTLENEALREGGRMKGGIKSRG
jgi:hypothetical protein